MFLPDLLTINQLLCLSDHIDIFRSFTLESDQMLYNLTKISHPEAKKLSSQACLCNIDP